MRLVDTGSKVMLTLHYPKGLRGLPIASTSNTDLLRQFKRVVLEEWQQRVEDSSDAGEELINRLEYNRVKAALVALIPEGNADGEAEGEAAN